MKTKGQYYLAVILMLLGCWVDTPAQETSGSETKGFPAQVSVVYPMGTHGHQSIDYVYNFSLNLFTGKVGGVNGLEISGLFGRVEGNVNGVQLAGLGNVSGNRVNGIQIAGLANISENMKGVQIAGLSNITENVSGLQFSGLANISENVKGIQVGGLTNISESMNGLQISGLCNIAENVVGVQIGGLANICEDIRGLQVNGLVNIAADLSGLQIAGLSNVTENFSGLKIAGLFNVCDKVSGVNIAGVYNRTRALRGFQLGIVNITDTIEKGISMALVNIVKKDFYNEWELSFSDYANVALSYKMGTRKFYTIYTAGASFMEDQLWVAGIGFGNRTTIGNRFDFQPELVFHTYFPNDFKDIQWTSATHLKLGFVYNINEKLGLSLAPSVYVMNADKGSEPGTDYYKVSPIGAIYTHEGGNSRVTIGLGISLGLILR